MHLFNFLGFVYECIGLRATKQEIKRMTNKYSVRIDSYTVRIEQEKRPEKKKRIMD